MTKCPALCLLKANIKTLKEKGNQWFSSLTQISK